MYLELFKSNKKKIILLDGEPKVTANSVEDIDSFGHSKKILSMLSSGTCPDAYWADEDNNLWEGFNICVGVPENVCPGCQFILSETDSITRKYFNKDGGNKISTGHYDNNGDFEPDTKPDLSDGRYDLVDGSDTCTNCGKVLG